MAYVVIEINAPGLSIAELNQKCHNSGNAHGAANLLSGLIAGIAGGAQDADLKVVTKDAATTINTSGSGSTSETYDLT